MSATARWKHRIKIGLLVTLSSILSIELSLRAYHAFEPLFIFHDDSYNRFRGKPHADDWNFKLNSRGFKDIEFGPREAGTLRVVAIGDSFTFGVVPYQYNFLTLLDDELDDDAGEVEILNMGIPAVGPPVYLSLLVDEGMALDPDLVLLSLYVGNDFHESHPRDEKRALYTYSYLASLAMYLTRIRPQFEGVVPHGAGFYLDHIPTLSEGAHLNMARNRGFLFLEGHPQFLRLADEALSYLTQIQALCDQRGVPLLVVIIPDELQVDRSLRRRVQRGWNLAQQQRWRDDQPNTLLAARFAKAGIDSVDLLEPFRAESASGSLYRPRDSHWNIPGNRLAADQLLPRLRRWADEARRDDRPR